MDLMTIGDVDVSKANFFEEEAIESTKLVKRTSMIQPRSAKEEKIDFKLTKQKSSQSPFEMI
jgi:hypothetical protein